MSEKSIGYDVELSAEDEGTLTTRIRMNFKLLANGTAQPDVTIETEMPAFPDDETLVRMTSLNSKAITIATLLGRRWEKVWKYAVFAEPDVENARNLTMPEQEEIEGWLVSRT